MSAISGKKSVFLRKRKWNAYCPAISGPSLGPSFFPGPPHQEAPSALYRAHDGASGAVRPLVLFSHRPSPGSSGFPRAERNDASATSGTGRERPGAAGAEGTDQSGNFETDHGHPSRRRGPGGLFLHGVPAQGTPDEGTGSREHQTETGVAAVPDQSAFPDEYAQQHPRACGSVIPRMRFGSIRSSRKCGAARSSLRW